VATRTSGSAGGPGKRTGSKDRHRAPGPPNQEKVRDGRRVVNKALVIAYGVHETGRREVIGLDVGQIESNDAALIRLAGMLLIEQNDEWLVARRYLSQESLTALKAQQTELSGLTDPGQGHYLQKEENSNNNQDVPAALAA